MPTASKPPTPSGPSLGQMAWIIFLALIVIGCPLGSTAGYLAWKRKKDSEQQAVQPSTTDTPTEDIDYTAYVQSAKIGTGEGETFASKSKFKTSDTEMTLRVNFVSGLKQGTKVEVSWYDPQKDLVHSETKIYNGEENLDFVYNETFGFYEGRYSAKIVVAHEKYETVDIEVEEEVKQTSLDPDELDLSAFMQEDEETVVDWERFDSDGDGLQEGCYILDMPNDESSHHILILDWSDEEGSYVAVYNKIIAYDAVSILVDDRNGDNKNDFIIVHTEYSNDVTPLVYDDGEYRELPAEEWK